MRGYGPYRQRCGVAEGSPDKPLRTDAPHFDELVALMAQLRQECAWTQQQTAASLLRFVIAEAYEVVEAVERGTPAQVLEELGDLLLQVVFQAVIAEQRHQFDIDDVVQGLVDKLIRRNPHVFGGHQLSDPAAITAQWQAIKAAEKESNLPGGGAADWVAEIPAHLPALLRVVAVAEKLGTQYHPAPMLASSTSVGDQLLAIALAATADGLDPEQELRAAIDRWVAQQSDPAK